MISTDIRFLGVRQEVNNRLLKPFQSNIKVFDMECYFERKSAAILADRNHFTSTSAVRQ